MEACYGKHREDYSLASSSSYYGKVTGRLIRDLSCFHTFSNLQLSVDSISELFWFYFSSLHDWSRKLVPLFQPIRFKTKPNCVLVNSVFPRFRQLTCIYFEFSLAPYGISLDSDWDTHSNLALFSLFGVKTSKNFSDTGCISCKTT